MKKIVFLCILTACYTAIIAQEHHIEKQKPSAIAFSIAEKDLFPEGITYDSKTEQFFLGSISKKKIIAVGKEGKQADFIKPEQDDISGCLGLKVDTQRRRLWALSYDGKWNEDKTASVHIFDIDSKKLVKKLSAERGKTPAFNDLTLTADGGAYISDCLGHAVYYVGPDLENLDLFIRSDELLRGANGIVMSQDGSFLYVASGTKGIVLLDLATKKIRPITNRLGVDTTCIDGLMYYKNILIGILNPVYDPSQHCIVRYYLSENGKEIIAASIIDQNNPLFAVPTTGVIADDELYCLAATFLNQLSDDGNYDAGKLKNPLVLKYKLN